MFRKEKSLLSWSGGKDSALALIRITNDENCRIVAILTSLTEDYNRISMHGTRQVLLEKQAESLGLPLETVYIPKNSSNEEYESKMRTVLNKFKKIGVTSVVFGDVYLEDVKKYREENLSRIGMKTLFPLWGSDTSDLATEFIDLGFKAIITCIDSKFLDKKFVGREFDKAFLSELPTNVDPCGEKGEFHSFVYAGPIFEKEISFKKGRIVRRNNRFFFCDLLPT
jgi:uncharacterized protein (TIGR00290 family)